MMMMMMTTTKKKILVIDDEESIRAVLEIHLRSAGYEVDTAATGREGIELALSGNPDLVICDLKLSDVMGLEIIKTLKEKKDIPTIAVSGFIDEDLIKEARETGAADYLKKPFLKEELLSIVTGVLGNGEASSQDI